VICRCINSGPVIPGRDEVASPESVTAIASM
jgi:hypothetical protein